MKKIIVMEFTALFFLSACYVGPNSPVGFSLPEGNTDRGELVFREMECLACHTMDGFDDEAVEKSLPKSVPLGGRVNSIQTHVQLVTSIINPSHRFASGFYQKDKKSPMKNYNDIITVSQLVDLVTFLQAQYKLKEYEQHSYRPYEY